MFERHISNVGIELSYIKERGSDFVMCTNVWQGYDDELICLATGCDVHFSNW